MFNWIKNLFCKENKKEKVSSSCISDEEFSKMSKPEKKDFLSNDLKERIIRIEQRVSSKFGKPVNYENTEFFKSLTSNQQRQFEKYLDRKRNRVLALVFFLVGIFVSSRLLDFNFTGSVVGITGKVSFSFLGAGALILVLFLFFIFVFRTKRKRRINECLSIINKTFKI
jgi:hypothetical protein